MKHYSRFLKLRINNKVINTVTLLILIVVMGLLIKNLYKAPEIKPPKVSISYSILGPERRYIIDDSSLEKLISGPLKVVNPKYTLTLDNSKRQAIIEIIDTPWVAGKVIRDTVVLALLNKAPEYVNIYISISYDSITQIMVLKPLAPSKNLKNNLLNSFYFIISLAILIILIILFKLLNLFSKPKSPQVDSVSQIHLPESSLPENSESNNLLPDSSFAEITLPERQKSVLEKAVRLLVDRKNVQIITENIKDRDLRNNLEILSEELLQKELLEKALATLQSEIKNIINGKTRPFTSKNMARELEILSKEIQQKEYLKKELEKLQTEIKSIISDKNIPFITQSVNKELEKIRFYYSQGKGLEKITKELKIEPKAIEIENYIIKKQVELTESISNLHHKIAGANSEISRLKNGNLQLETEITKLKEIITLELNKTKEKDLIALNLYSILTQFENDALGTNSNTLPEIEYRQYLLPKLLEICFYSIDYMKWYNGRSYSIENLEVLKSSRDGKLSMPETVHTKIVNEVNTMKYDAYINKLLLILKGVDIPSGILKKAESPRVFIGGYKLDI